MCPGAAMRDTTPFMFPEITEEDVAWACGVMGLKEGAFDDDARKAALLSSKNLDVAACPGSGKTTLLVAKLAILARKWTDRRRGICVLSHTNAAREVIEDRLGATAEGQLLLSHPHYIGTIHGFVDRFFGIPYLRHKGWDVCIDNDRCSSETEKNIFYVAGFNRAFKSAYRQLNHRNQNAFYWLKLSYLDEVVTVTPTCSEGHLDLFPEGTTLEEISRFQHSLKLSVSKLGTHAYDDMFAYGHRLLDDNTSVRQSITERFPVLFIDEAQDNSELQSSFLHRVFIEGVTNIFCQRYGDANQAIFHGINSKESPKTWGFPVSDIKHEILDSYRFGPTIAKLAEPLGVESQSLKGRGPDERKVKADVDKQHTIFLFDEHACKYVLPAYAKHLRKCFSCGNLVDGSFVAVGAKHKEPDNEKNKPNSVCDYWDKYAPKQAKAEPKPETFIGCVQAGRSKLKKDQGRNLYHMVEQIAAGLLETVRLAGGKPSIRQRKNRYVREMLEKNLSELGKYTEFICRFVVDEEVLTKQLWNDEWKSKLNDVVVALFDDETEYRFPAEFFAWPEDAEPDVNGGKTSIVYQHEDALPKIRLGSIHSVKGETHTSVLVLETYKQAPQLKKIKKWLLGKAGTEKQRNGQSARLKVHYVAMTRPTHLLCLAIPEGTFTATEVGTLNKERGWRIARIASDGAVAWDENSASKGSVPPVESVGPIL